MTLASLTPSELDGNYQKCQSFINKDAVMQYKVVFEVTATELESKVNELLNRGWEPLGGVSVSETLEQDVGVFNREEYSMSFVQAMIKK
ncbi:MAG: DUF1737 domain-containing protein [Pseudomonadota bacterium]|nr:DUF1737 domain-containing protein [Pseudomonadota bacterium]MDP1904998.1 DUF1737 domain-containing protein [Pseudomonadota bacterium]